MSLEVNGEVIEDEVIIEELVYHVERCQKNGVTFSREKLLEKVKEEIVLKTLLRQEIEKIHFTPSKELLEREVNLFKKWNQKATTISEIQLEKYILYKLKEERLIETLAQKMEPPKESHLRQFYQDNKNDYLMKKKYLIAQVRCENHQVGDQKEMIDFFSDLEQSSKRKNLVARIKNHPQILLEMISGFDEELTLEGRKMIRELEQRKVFLREEIVFFKPFRLSKEDQFEIGEKKKKSLYHYCLVEVKENYLPLFEEIISLIRQDLIEEMKKIKLNLYLRQLMHQGKIVDNVYLN